MIKSIETEYNGYRFRSRLEARWAVFFDALGIEYEYEPEGFELPSGKRYLPDFRVKCHGVRGEYTEPQKNDGYPFDLYIEVKGCKVDQEYADKLREFANLPDDTYDFDYGVNSNPLLIVGDIPYEGCSSDSSNLGAYDGINGTDIFPFNYLLIDGDMFAAYPAAHHGHFYLWGDDSNYINVCDIEPVESAYRKARQARFEFGETPRVKGR